MLSDMIAEVQRAEAEAEATILVLRLTGFLEQLRCCAVSCSTFLQNHIGRYSGNFLY